MWLAPVQVMVLTISEGAVPYGQKVHRRLLEAGLRAELDAASDKISYKIRAASREKPPYILVVGAREAEKGTVNVRAREAPERQEEVELEAFASRVVSESQMEF